MTVQTAARTVVIFMHESAFTRCPTEGVRPITCKIFIHRSTRAAGKTWRLEQVVIDEPIPMRLLKTRLLGSAKDHFIALVRDALLEDIQAVEATDAAERGEPTKTVEADDILALHSCLNAMWRGVMNFAKESG